MRFAPLVGPELHELLKEDPEQVRELPLDAPLVILRLPIAGG